ncbi:MAG: 50S ribosomal protein L33 [bacterium]
MSQDNLLKMTCSVCKQNNYFMYKNKKKLKEKLELKKFCKWCKKHTLHTEKKIK